MFIACFRSIAFATLCVFSTLPANAYDWSQYRYMENTGTGHCEQILKGSDIVADFPIVQPYLDAAEVKGVPVKSCTYKYFLDDDKKTIPQYGWAILADPSPSMLDSWISNACSRNAPKSVPECVNALTSFISSQSGGQFPIIGFVSEGSSKDELCVQHTKVIHSTGLIAFEDGVTVQLNASDSVEPEQKTAREGIYCSTDGWGADVQQWILKTHKIQESFHKSRLSGYDDRCGAFVTQEIRKQAESEGRPPWLIASRVNFIQALKTGVDEMMNRQAERFARGEDLGSSCH
ncbi:hypothetical protein G6K86_32205 [Agrobacterium rhizogenes]|nr:hypothetical protein [Rhizobium rhizogenes]